MSGRAGKRPMHHCRAQQTHPCQNQDLRACLPEHRKQTQGLRHIMYV